MATFVNWVLEVLPLVCIKLYNQIENIAGFLHLSELVAVSYNSTNWDLFGFTLIAYFSFEFLSPWLLSQMV
jgi:hypothetical protein